MGCEMTRGGSLTANLTTWIQPLGPRSGEFSLRAQTMACAHCHHNR